MAAPSDARDDRIEIRTTKEEKRLLTAAAEHERLLDAPRRLVLPLDIIEASIRKARG